MNCHQLIQIGQKFLKITNISDFYIHTFFLFEKVLFLFYKSRHFWRKERRVVTSIHFMKIFTRTRHSCLKSVITQRMNIWLCHSDFKLQVLLLFFIVGSSSPFLTSGLLTLCIKTVLEAATEKNDLNHTAHHSAKNRKPHLSILAFTEVRKKISIVTVVSKENIFLHLLQGN